MFDTRNALDQKKDFTEYITVPTSYNLPSVKQREYLLKTIAPLSSLPKIYSKYLNKASLVNTYDYNSNVNESNQSNGVKLITNDDDEDSDEEEESKHSKLFIYDQSKDEYFMLEFRATNVTVVPVYLKHRTFEENKNDKCNQQRSKSVYENTYDNRARRFHQLVKTFKIDQSDDRLSIMSFKKPLLEKRKTFSLKPKEKPSISAPNSNVKQSIIYITYKDVEYKIKPGLMNLRSSNPINFEAEEKRERLLKSLNMQLPTDYKNKAQIVCNYKGDVLKFLFTITDINCNKLKVTSSIGIMAMDESVYVKEFSTISNRTIYISVPKTNYHYVDKMINIKHKNMYMKLKKIDPIWLVEQRKKRFKEYYQCRKHNPYEDLLELKIGSNICYESFNCVNKVKGGTLPCSVSDKQYEQWVYDMQKTDLPQIDDSYGEKFESVFANDVPNWDLVLNSK